MYARYNKEFKTIEFPRYDKTALIDTIHNTLVWNPKEEDYIRAGYQVVTGPEPEEREGYTSQIVYHISDDGIITYTWEYTENTKEIENNFIE